MEFPRLRFSTLTTGGVFGVSGTYRVGDNIDDDYYRAAERGVAMVGHSADRSRLRHSRARHHRPYHPHLPLP